MGENQDSAQAQLSTTLPVFFKHSDIIGRTADRQDNTVRPYEVCSAIARAVDVNMIEGAQKIGNIWRIYLKDNATRIQLLAKSFTLRNKRVSLFDKNPAVTRVQDPNEEVTKITIRDIPLSVDNSEIERYLTSKGVKLTTSIRYGLERNEQNKLTSFKNGDRFTYAKSPIPPLPRNNHIGTHRARIFYKGQPNTNCTICKSEDHKTGSEDCPAYKNVATEIISVRSHLNVLSNFYMQDINYKGKTYSSVEHAYQAVKANHAGLPDLAREISCAPHAGEARRLGNTIPENTGSDWDNKAPDVMMDLLLTKAADDNFGKALMADPDKTFVHPVADKFWGTGLSPEITARTHPDWWPGKNKLGELLSKVRKQVPTSLPKDVSTPQTPHQSRSRGRDKSSTPARRSESLKSWLHRSPSGKRKASTPPTDLSNKAPKGSRLPCDEPP